MMVGHNELHLNEATMIEAVQYWINSLLVKNKPIVKSISCSVDTYSKTFVVGILSEEKKDEE